MAPLILQYFYRCPRADVAMGSGVGTNADVCREPILKHSRLVWLKDGRR